ncbi:MAG: molybdopterin molybdotransferase MoeA [Candidatus Bathyarchaeota archaeon]|nr:molybdopterin molybdotransferase MoeA [Candidatus Bathyarchaeota archaeon]
MARLKGFQKLTFADEALQKWLGTLQISPPRQVTVSLGEALNRVSAVDITAQEDLPRFDRSAVDGYALKAEDTTGASQFKPVVLSLTASDTIATKQARQIWTGNPLPRGADAVVMLENTKLRDGKLEVWTQLAKGGNVSKKGEDVKKGDKIIKAGTRLSPYHLALLAALGNSEIKVAEKPQIGILATGNELVEAGATPSENQIYESNRVMLSALCREIGAEPVDFGIAKDDLAEITEKLKAALQKCDAVVTSGGTSVGGFDLVPEAVNNLGKPGVITHGVAIRPAMPTALAVVEGKPVLILSGNPVAAAIGFEVFGRPLICKLLGMPQTEQRPVVNAVMARRVATALGRKTFVRVHVTIRNGVFIAEPISARGSGIISTMTRSNGFVIVPENREGVAEGESVMVHLFGSVEEER